MESTYAFNTVLHIAQVVIWSHLTRNARYIQHDIEAYCRGEAASV